MANQISQQLKVALVAGETSGDLLAGSLLDGLREQWPLMTAVGIGGPQMARRGLVAWWGHEQLLVDGVWWEVLRRLPEIGGIRPAPKTRLLLERPDVFIGVD